MEPHNLRSRGPHGGGDLRVLHGASTASARRDAGGRHELPRVRPTRAGREAAATAAENLTCGGREVSRRSPRTWRGAGTQHQLRNPADPHRRRGAGRLIGLFRFGIQSSDRDAPLARDPTDSWSTTCSARRQNMFNEQLTACCSCSPNSLRRVRDRRALETVASSHSPLSPPSSSAWPRDHARHVGRGRAQRAAAAIDSPDLESSSRAILLHTGSEATSPRCSTNLRHASRSLADQARHERPHRSSRASASIITGLPILLRSPVWSSSPATSRR